MCKIDKISKATTCIILDKNDFGKTKLSIISELLRKNTSIKKVAFDLENVEILGNNFFDFLVELSFYKEISIYNLDAGNLSLFYLMQHNRDVSLFINKNDFVNNKNSLVKREFALCF